MTIEVFTPRWKRLLTNLFLGKGGGGGGPLIVLDDVMPVVSVVDPSQNEQHFIRGEVAWAIATAVAGGGATFGCLTINNPIGSGKIIVVEEVTASGNTGASTIYIAFGGPTVALTQPSSSTDGRSASNGLQGFAQPQVMSDPTALAAIPPAAITNVIVSRLQMPAGWGPVELLARGQDIIMTPGTTVWIYMGTVNLNVTLTVTGYWREAEQQELTGI